ncbi:Na/Pi cotransporter family protein [Pseudoduganella ginsengisoli]|uniref:Na/Pi cotransporter family protein n=1 Tax=Pseudoduganella ginsengisoli TaxID=1462440 RepID=A0A6L6Q9G0_9BURK|nr:Na/Pi cotransporter family protein [Pseudoduganella ginsengisoli]MTW06094.1 Na/Pi cotransporter family protein [Pseudoduganella ginsengisoli]
MGAKVLLDLLGGVALLLWGLHMVHSGIVRAFGSRIRRFLSLVLQNRYRAFAAGVGVTAILQSSTATALMLSSFTASGLVGLVPALAVLLGANVGTTLIVQLLSFDSSVFSPVLLICGVAAFKRGTRTIVKDMGRVAVGLGLMLLSLHLLLDSLAPAENAPGARQLFAALTGEPVLALLIGTLMAWLAHSSVATILLTMSLSAANFVSPVPALALVLGANLGSSINPLMETGSANPAHRRLPVGNLINRIAGCVLFLPLLDPVARLIQAIDPNPVRLAADFHALFNVVMALLFIVPLQRFARMLERLLPDVKSGNDLSIPLYLGESINDTPSVALACAARETLRMGDIVDSMLDQAMTAILMNDRKLVTEVSQKDNAVDGLHEAVKLYVINVTHGPLDEVEARRALEVLSLAINLEHIGDIIDKNLMELANKKIKRQLHFSAEGARELQEFHRVVRDHLRLAMSIFLSGDLKSARLLLKEKARVREMEFAASENHIARLKEGRIDSMETSTLHIDILRDLKRIHSHVCSAAYAALKSAGELDRAPQQPAPRWVNPQQPFTVHDSDAVLQGKTRA